jgi:CRISPR-associated protein Cmr4
MGLAISAHNSLDRETKSSKALWYEEALPPDTVMYTLLSERRCNGEALARLTDRIAANPYLQLGGNETVGQGWFRLAKLEGGGR